MTYAVVIVCGAAGFGLIMYDILKNTKTRLLLDEFKKQQTREDVEQKDKKNNERNNGDDKYAPTN
ncbi:MAG: hypothetical protein FIO02_04080 [Nitrosopumilales archaeon]|nr:hypothetical protein [Nitrosopumilales archaeon]